MLERERWRLEGVVLSVRALGLALEQVWLEAFPWGWGSWLESLARWIEIWWWASRRHLRGSSSGRG